MSGEYLWVTQCQQAGLDDPLAQSECLIFSKLIWAIPVFLGVQKISLTRHFANTWQGRDTFGLVLVVKNSTDRLPPCYDIESRSRQGVFRPSSLTRPGGVAQSGILAAIYSASGVCIIGVVPRLVSPEYSSCHWLTVSTVAAPYFSPALSEAICSSGHWR